MENTLNPHLKRHEYLPENVLELRHYYFETHPEDELDLTIITGGYEKCTSEFEFRRNSYPFYVLEFVTKGSLVVEIGNKKNILTPGTIGGFVPKIPHHYKAKGKENTEHFFISFSGKKADFYFNQSLLSQNFAIKVNNYFNTTEFAQMMYKRASEKGPFSHEICCCHLKAMLLELADIELETQIAASQSLQTYKKCKSFIDENFSKPISVVNVAKSCDVNSKYMSRLFKKHLKITPSEYIMRLKLNKASSLLMSTSFSIKNIAYLIGMDDQYHFSRNFKKFYSISPREYRKNHGN